MGSDGPPSTRPLDVPGPFEEQGPLVLCMGDTRLDAPGAPGVDPAWTVLGLCVPAGAAGSSCAADADCADEQACVCGLCRVPVCRTNADCPSGLDCSGAGGVCRRRCVEDADCPDGKLCDPSTLGCTASCVVDADCQFGKLCSQTRSLCVAVTCHEAGCWAGRACDLQRRVVEYASPSVIEGEAGDVMWLGIEGTGTVRFVDQGLAGFRALPATPVLGGELSDAQVAPDGDGLFLVAGRPDGSGIFALSSRDGISWDDVGDGEALFAPELEWERGWVGRPSALRDEGGWLVAYEGGPGAGVGLVFAPDGGPASRLGTEPVLVPATAGSGPWWAGIEEVGSPRLFVQDCAGGWTGVALLFSGVGLEWIGVDVGSPDPLLVNSSVGYARLDGADLCVDPANPVFTTMAGIAVTRDERAAFPVCGPTGWALYYTASDPGTGRLQGLFVALSF